jgi:hypothetical protein
MKQAIFAVVALLAFAGVASADGLNAHAEPSIQGTGTPADGDHVIDATVGTDGSASVVVDGQSVLP